MLIIDVKKTLEADDKTFTLNFGKQIEPGKLIALTGPSGAGKTSVLRTIAGLMAPDKGYISINGQTWLDTENKQNLPTQQRKIGFVFQDYSLFPHMTVLKNLQFACRGEKDEPFLNEIVETMGLSDFTKRFPQQLSGGQQQRVALARALVSKPNILLLDEPMAALDHEMRTSMQDYLLKIHRQFNITTILVSHDLPEIFKLADQVIALNQGKIANHGAPGDVFGRRKEGDEIKFSGEVLEIRKSEKKFLVTVLVGDDIVNIPSSSNKITDLSVGDQVVLVAETINPKILKLTPKK